MRSAKALAALALGAILQVGGCQLTSEAVDHALIGGGSALWLVGVAFEVAALVIWLG